MVFIKSHTSNCTKISFSFSQPKCFLSQPAFTCSKLTIKTPKQQQWRRFGVSIVNFEQVIAGWDRYYFGRRSSELAELVNRFPVCFNLFVFLFLLTPCIVVGWLFSLAWSESHLKKIANMKGCVLVF